MNSDAYVMKAIKTGLGAANKCCFNLTSILVQNYFHAKLNASFIKLIRPVFIWGSETWTVGKHGKTLLISLERKALRKIFGPVLEKGF